MSSNENNAEIPSSMTTNPKTTNPSFIDNYAGWIEINLGQNKQANKNIFSSKQKMNSMTHFLNLYNATQS